MRYNKDIFSIFFNMMVYCVFSLESPYRGDSNENTQYLNMKKVNHCKLSKMCSYEIFSKGHKEFETDVVNEPSVFEPLKFYCSFLVPTATSDSTGLRSDDFQVYRRVGKKSLRN